MNIVKTAALLILITFLVLFSLDSSAKELPLLRVRGSEFSGGAKDVFGAIHYDLWGVNYIYAKPTGALSSMETSFSLQGPPEGELYLHIHGRDDNAPTTCPIEIRINEHLVFEGANEFSGEEWTWKAYPVAEGVLKEGANRIAIANIADEGEKGSPPWFMVGLCIVGPRDTDRSIDATFLEDFRIHLPEEAREIPEPYADGEPFKGFTYRGTKGWLWSPEQYLAEIPVLAEYQMNFLMNCYGSMCDIEHYPWGHPECNRWWEPLSPKKKAGFEEIVRRCQEHDIDFCFSMNPNLGSKRPLDYSSDEDFEDLWKHYEWMQDLGVEWFNVSLDDITRGIDASGQARVVNRLFARLRERDPDAQFIFTPTHYWGTGTDDPYLETLKKELQEDIFVFWTGTQVVSSDISGADSYRNAVGHRLFLWDNYPNNNGRPTLHLGPVTGRGPRLHESVEGYMSNPMHSENEINRLPLLTCADYAYNPENYDPRRSIGQAILHLAQTEDQRLVLKDLAELYPGKLVLSVPSGAYNPVIERFDDILVTPHSRFLSRLFIDHVKDVVSRMEEHFPNQYEAARRTVLADIERMETAYRTKYGE